MVDIPGSGRNTGSVEEKRGSAGVTPISQVLVAGTVTSGGPKKIAITPPEMYETSTILVTPVLYQHCREVSYVQYDLGDKRWSPHRVFHTIFSFLKGTYCTYRHNIRKTQGFFR